MTLTEILWFFFSYSILGWILETVFGTVKRKHFINRGLMNGPWCPIYGVSAVVISYIAVDLAERPFFLFLGSAVIASFIEFVTGQLTEKIFHKKLWDYSNLRYHAEGFVSLTSAVVWGLLGLLGYYFIHPLFLTVHGWIPAVVRIGVLIFLGIVLAIDCLCTFSAFFHYKNDNRKLEEVNKGLGALTVRLGVSIGHFVVGRMEKNFSGETQEEAAEGKSKTLVFAEGCGFYKLTLLFVIGAFLGDIIETVFCYATTGVIMSRSSVVYGPFSVVWGIGIVILTATLYRFKDKADRYIIMAGTLLGGAYEYLCSVFTERFFGTVFWDYSEIPFNLGGRINLLYCFFWGIAALIWLKAGYPFFSGLIEKIPRTFGKWMTWFIVVFMIFNMSISVFALVRYNERHQGSVPDNEWEVYLDQHFDDEKMEKIYPNAKMTE